MEAGVRQFQSMRMSVCALYLVGGRLLIGRLSMVGIDGYYGITVLVVWVTLRSDSRHRVRYIGCVICPDVVKCGSAADQ